MTLKRITRARLIPARAGNTPIATITKRGVAAHPRSRGEHRSALTTAYWLVGSSPLARGTHSGRGRAPDTGRLIPARAGNTGVCEGLGGRGSAHPRSRGEHAALPRCEPLPPGSSPLARGTPENRADSVRNSRLIPARAGNTLELGIQKTGGAAHPRSRGEHYENVIKPVFDGGSSPLARGTRLVGRGGRESTRLIPARAGNTSRVLLPPPVVSAHPRSRGEHRCPLLGASGSCGSSPLARGTRRA